MVTTFFSSVSRRAHLPLGFLMVFLQRSPVLRVAGESAGPAFVSRAADVLRGIFAAAAGIGAVNTMVGATTTSGGTGGTAKLTALPSGQLSVKVGDVAQAAFVVSGSGINPGSWSMSSGSLPPGTYLATSKVAISGTTTSDPINSGNTTIYLLGIPTTAGTYNFKISSWYNPNADPSGGVVAISYKVVVSANTSAPAISTQPTSLSVTAGQAATFSVSASGASLSYQWKKGGTAISGATSATYTIASTTFADDGDYAVTVTNTYGSVTSNAATLTVTQVPAITSQPSSLALNAGASASFSVVASGSPTLTYQWLKGGTAISGATSATYYIASVSSANAGSYAVTVTNSVGSVTSSIATLTLNKLPTISTAPSGATVVAGASASFTVKVTGTSPFSYQWKKDGVAISGATNATYSVAKTSGSDAGFYTVEVTNVAGTTTSAAALLVVNTPPGTDTIASSETVIAGKPIALTVTATGTSPFTYQWKKDGVGIPGATLSTFSIASVKMSDAGVYTVEVSNIAGTTTSAAITLIVASPIVVQVQPLSQTAEASSTATFSVAATGQGTVTFQWQKDGVDIPGATQSSYTINGIQTSDNGFYSVVLTDEESVASSRYAELKVATPVEGALTNMSVRSVAGSGGNPLIVGFVVQGGPRDVLVRAAGPTLGSFNVSGTLADPNLAVHATLNGIDTVLFSNNDWSDSGLADTLSATFASVGAFAFPAGSKDAAVVTNVDPAPATQIAQTVWVNSNVMGESGVVLVEGYDAKTGGAGHLVNLSARNFVGTDSQVLIAGFYISGNVPKRLLIRAVGPGLAQFNVEGTVSDPTLFVHGSVNNADAVVASNDNWGDEPNADTASASAGAFALPAGSKDAAVVVTLPAGSYSAVCSGVNGATGEGIVEVYELP